SAPFSKPAAGETRSGDWRPGGTHKDPRDRFKKKNRPERAWSESDVRRDREKLGPPPPRDAAGPPRTSPNRPPGGSGWQRKPPGPPRGDRPWQGKPSGGGPRDRPWQDKKTGAPAGRPWSGKPSGDRPRGDRP